MKWNIVLDSSCDLVSSVTDDGIGISVVPMKIIIDNEEFVDNPSLDIPFMMRRMKEFKGATGSACPSPGEFAERFKWAENTICITMTGALSATFESAVKAKELVQEEHPDKNIHVVDSCATGGKMVLIAEEAERLIREGKSFDEIVTAIDEFEKSVKFIFSLAAFDNLIKNGRMPKYQGMLGSILKMRPVAIATAGGTIEVIDKPRGEKAMLKKMIERMQDMKDLDGLQIIIDHCDNLDAVTKLKEMIESVAKVKDVRLVNTKGLCSFYCDVHGFIVAF